MLTTGTILSSRYEILSVLGKGGMGSVYLAQARELGNKKVAIKELELVGFAPEELPKAVEQFKKEARFLAHLEHPNLVPVSDFFTVDGKHYLVMAYVEGEDLQRKMAARGKSFAWDEIKDWVWSLIEVLAYLHDHDPPILFRDLKPSNIMVANSGRLHLIDFGIARTARTGDRTCTFLQGTGTRGFSPLEQFGCEESCDNRSDIYSLGATLYYLLTGKRPPDAIERVAQKKKVKPASDFQPTLPAGFDAVLEKALAISAEDRYQSVQEFGAALRALKPMKLYTRKVVAPAPPTDPKEAPTEDLNARSYVGLEKRLSQVAVACLGVLFLGLSATPAKLAEARKQSQSDQRVAVANVDMPSEAAAQASLASLPVASKLTEGIKESKAASLPSNNLSTTVVSEKVKPQPVAKSSKPAAEVKRSRPTFDLGISYPKAAVSASTAGLEPLESQPVPEAPKPAPPAAAKQPPAQPVSAVNSGPVGTVTLPEQNVTSVGNSAGLPAAPAYRAGSSGADRQGPPGYYSSGPGGQVAVGGFPGGGGFGGPQRGGHGGGGR